MAKLFLFTTCHSTTFGEGVDDFFFDNNHTSSLYSKIMPLPINTFVY